jgi:hypothetical protein
MQQGELFGFCWPPSYTSIFRQREARYRKITKSPKLMAGAFKYYSTRPEDFIEDWCVTYDPRNAKADLPTILPFVLFERQRELVAFLVACLDDQESGLIEKSRDMGATWVCCCFSVWLWIFYRGASVGWGSRKEQLVDKIGDPDSIFEKMRMVIDNLPRFFWPRGFQFQRHAAYMKIINPENGATITGEAGDNIGRGGRKLIYFKDESAHYERPSKIESALGDNTNVQIDISSVNGTATIFDRRRKAGMVWTKDSPPPKGAVRVFILDWRDHPAKTDEWYNTRRARAEREGLLTLFAQEVDRDASAAVEGVVIPVTWVRSAIDAHIKLGIKDEGAILAALDVADEGQDQHALAIRRGVVLQYVQDWPQGDTGKATRKAVSVCKERKASVFYYDCIGVGAGVKAETNRLKEEKLLKNLTIMKWNSAAKPLNPEQHILMNPDGTPDTESPKNKDFFGNLKAQGWWKLRLRFEKTHQMITGKAVYPHDELISIPSTLPKRRELEDELSQPTVGYDGKSRLIINKQPSGTKSPNLGDSVMMNYWPIPVPVTEFNLESIEGVSRWG